MVIAQERHRGREIEGLAETLQGAHGDEVPKTLALTGDHRHQAPEQAPAENHPLARHAVTEQAGRQCDGGINPHEGRADQALLDLVEAELLMEFG